MKSVTAENMMKKYKMPFGKYFGKEYKWVLLNDAKYTEWVIESVIGFSSVNKYFQINLKLELISIEEALKNMHQPKPNREYEIYEVLENRDNEGHNPFASIDIEECRKYIFNESKRVAEYEVSKNNIFQYELNKVIKENVLRHYIIEGILKNKQDSC